MRGRKVSYDCTYGQVWEADVGSRRILLCHFERGQNGGNCPKKQSEKSCGEATFWYVYGGNVFPIVATYIAA